MKSRILSSCLLASLLLGALASCGGEAETTANDTTPAGNDTPAETEAAEESPYEKDALPELDFGGTAFRVLYRDDLVDSFSLVMGGVQTKFNRSMADNNPNWASTYAAIEQSAEETLQKFYSDAAALD